MKLYAKCAECHTRDQLVGYVYDDETRRAYRVEPMPVLHLGCTVDVPTLIKYHNQLTESDWYRQTAIRIEEIEALLAAKRSQDHSTGRRVLARLLGSVVPAVDTDPYPHYYESKRYPDKYMWVYFDPRSRVPPYFISIDPITTCFADAGDAETYEDHRRITAEEFHRRLAAHYNILSALSHRD